MNRPRLVTFVSLVIALSLALAGSWLTPAAADGPTPEVTPTPTPSVSPQGHTNWD